MHIGKFNGGFTMVEVLVITLLMTIILASGSLLFIAGQNAFSLTAARADIQENARRTLEKISLEVQQSGRDSGNNLMVTVLDGAGVNGTDILRFSIPLCVCGTSPITGAGNVNHWGAPLKWGQPGCGATYSTNAQGKVNVCHYPPGNPNNPQNLSVAPDAVKAHLAHGDFLGTCGTCDPNNYTNRTIEYLMDSSGRLLRRVINTNNGNAVINSVVFAQRLTDFQLDLDTTGQKAVVTTTVTLSETASENRKITMTNSMAAILRN